MGEKGWAVPAKLDVYMWFGEKRGMNYLNDEELRGYDTSTPDVKNAIKVPPIVLRYPDSHKFQLRAYLYMARSLIGSDSSGLSDPFVRVMFGKHCKTSRIINESISPVWDETLVIDDIELHGFLDRIVKSPPDVVIELYDYDTLGDPEFLGRVVAKPKTKLIDVAYDEPDFPAKLQWYDVYRGQKLAGELLASFELLQVLICWLIAV